MATITVRLGGILMTILKNKSVNNVLYDNVSECICDFLQMHKERDSCFEDDT
ncbi:MAG: hypothetical protein JSC189_000383 [Candidatus Tokpelaia sp. JSC189]|nr:MAG: hypothetical protein JSC189_000383 [Candidatus Tokpelaia sp. JSC189]